MTIEDKVLVVEDLQDDFPLTVSESDATNLIDNAAALMNLLSRLYLKEMDADTIELMRNMQFPAKTDNDLMDKGIYMIVSYLSKTGLRAESELRADYARIFIGNGLDSFSAAYPIESVHTGRKRLVMQSSRDEVLAIYRAFGVERTEELKEGEDHIAYELAFLHTIMERCAIVYREGRFEEARNYLLTLRNFIDDHILTWVPQFTEQMRFFSKTDFYRGLSYMTVGFLDECSALIDELLANEGIGADDE